MAEPNWIVIENRLVGTEYNEEVIRDLLVELGYVEVRGSEQSIDFKTKENDDRTEYKFKFYQAKSLRNLFILTENNRIIKTHLHMQDTDKFYSIEPISKITWSIVAIVGSLILAAVIFVGFKAVNFVKEVISYEPNYEQPDPDDYDNDGDVDLNDGIKYLEDSLKEDANDNDDW